MIVDWSNFYGFITLGQSNLSFRKVRFLVHGLLLHGEKEVGCHQVFMVGKFLVGFLRDPPESSTDTENLRFG